MNELFMNAEQNSKLDPDGGLRQSDPQQATDSSDVSRRIMLRRAGWAVPVIVAVSLPNKVLAGSANRVGIDRAERDKKPKEH